MKRGRKEHSYEAQDGTIIQGLRRTVDGRWRYWTPEGKEVKFTEVDEAAAIRRFRQATRREVPSVVIPVAKMTPGELFGEESSLQREIFGRSLDVGEDEAGNFVVGHKVNLAAIWEWCRGQIIADQVNAAKMLRLPGIATLDFNAQPEKAVSLDGLRDLYLEKAESNWRTKGQVKSAFQRLKKVTGAVTLVDLTTPLLIQFREELARELAPTGCAAVYGKIKSAIAFAMKHGSLDNRQLAACLARTKVLYAGKTVTPHKPTPISRDDFHKLLRAADDRWRAILLLGLNGALYAEDIAGLKWAGFNLDTGTYTGSRAKTTIVRVMALWPETVKALRDLPRRAESPFVFTSATGTRYMATTLYDSYKSLRERVRVSTPFSGLRDAGYTIACEKCDNTVARVFAAHKAPGLQDNYVARRPEFVRPAADAIRAVFAPFPISFGAESGHFMGQ